MSKLMESIKNRGHDVVQEEYEMLVSDIQKECSKSNRRKDYAIIVLIILMFLEAVAFLFWFCIL